MHGASNCLPFQKANVSTFNIVGEVYGCISHWTMPLCLGQLAYLDKQLIDYHVYFLVILQLSDKAALLFRQYVKDSLYDRISTRPFLSSIEKKWVAFQLLCALNQCHKLQVRVILHFLF